MKIEIKGKVVESAYFELHKSGIGEIIINTRDKYVYPKSQVNSWSFNEDYTLGRYRIKFEYKYKSSVEFVAETDEEDKVLRYLPYEQHCKDQKIILLVPSELT